MTTMTAQPPLPMLPGQATLVGEAAGLVEDETGGAVFVHGWATFGWAASDEPGRRLAAVQLVRFKVAKQYEVAAAFGVDEITVWRWENAYAEAGVAGLLPARPGPKGPSKLTDELVARIGELRTAGKTIAAIAEATGVSTFTVRKALGRVGAAQPERAPTATAVAGEEAGNDEQAELVAVPDPAPRTTERALARAGLLAEAAPMFTEGAKLPLAGLALALPALSATGLLDAASEVYGRLRNGFYGLRAAALSMVFLALLGEPRAEGATRVRPADLGRLLGLDRAPEVKTIRRKLSELAARRRGEALITALAARHVAARPQALGFLYVDGHMRVYTGKRNLPKAHIARMRIAAPATAETWVGDAAGDPVLVICAKPSDSLATELRRLLPDLRALIGPDRRATIVFDRGGYSPALFADILAAKFDVLTYRKGTHPNEPDKAFRAHRYIADDGVIYHYQLADRRVRLPLPADHPSGRKTITLRQVTRRADDGHQIAILTSRADLPAAEVAYRMSARWRQENFFKYGRTHFALDALDSYAAHADDPHRSVPNPAKRRARASVAAARAALAEAEASYSAAVDAAFARAGATGQAQTINPGADRRLREARHKLAEAKRRSAATAARAFLHTVDPDAAVLDEQRKLITHAIRMAAFNAESALARLLRGHYARADDEGRALLREAFKTTGDIHIDRDTLHVDLDPLSAPRRSRALAALAAELTATETRYPDTDLKIEYTVKGYPRPA
jgi:transposase